MEQEFSPEQLRSARLATGLTQQQAATRLSISQAYLALIENGRRSVTPRLATSMVTLYGLGPLALPVTADKVDSWTSASLADAVASLGYPGLPCLAALQSNPAVVLLGALASANLEVRVVEALPWVALEHGNLNWEWLIRETKVRDVQNRLGFVVTLARQTAEKRGAASAARRLKEVEEVLERARLAREDTLCQESLSSAERRWLRRKRTAVAVHWNLLTDIDSQSLPYAA